VDYDGRDILDLGEGQPSTGPDPLDIDPQGESPSPVPSEPTADSYPLPGLLPDEDDGFEPDGPLGSVLDDDPLSAKAEPVWLDDLPPLDDLADDLVPPLDSSDDFLGQDLLPPIGDTPDSSTPPVVIDCFLDAYNHYRHGGGKPAIYGLSILDRFESKDAFQWSVRRRMLQFFEVAKKRTETCGQSYGPVGFVHNDRITYGSNTQGPLIHCGYDWQMALTVNNYWLKGDGAFEWTSEVYRSCTQSCHCKYTITASATWIVRDVYTAMGPKNTFFNEIRGTPFRVSGVFMTTHKEIFYDPELPPLCRPPLTIAGI
jgi:hypothetical protein